MTPASFCDWLNCWIEDAEIGNKPTVAQWQTILKRLDQVDTGSIANPIGFVGQTEPHNDPDDHETEHAAFGRFFIGRQE